MTGPERSWTSSDPGIADAASAPVSAVELEQPFTANDLYTLRAAVTAHADAAGLPQQTVDALLIVTGELVSNVVQHGGGAGRLTLWRTGGDLICQVADQGPGMPDPEGAGRAAVPVNALGGRGIWIVRQLSRHVDIVAGPQGTTVTATIPVA